MLSYSMNWHNAGTGGNLALTVGDMGNLDKLEQLCALATVLDGMERDLGLNALSDLGKRFFARPIQCQIVTITLPLARC